MKRIFKHFPLGILLLLFPILSFGQNEFELNDRIKTVYSYEYKTVEKVLSSLIEKDFETAFEQFDEIELGKKGFYNLFKEIREKLLYAGMPNDSSITVILNDKVVPDYLTGEERFHRKVIFEISIKDKEIKEFDNKLFFEFFSDKEKNFESKTHDYRLNKMRMIPASYYKDWSDMLKYFNNVFIDSLTNSEK